MNTLTELIAILTGPEASIAIVTFSVLGLAFECALRINAADAKAKKPIDPYRMERFRRGEPLDPDELP